MTQTHPPAVDRRRFLEATGSTAVLAAMAGCLERFESGEGRDDLVLPPPENHDRLADANLDIPLYGEPLPEATVPSALSDRSVTTTEFVGDRHTMLTFIYTSCTTVCPGLTSSLRRVQADASERGYADEIALQTITFDPEYDTPDVLKAYGDRLGVDYDAENWYFLRPGTPVDAREIVTETFGVAYEMGDADGNAGAGAHGGDADHEMDGEDGHDTNGDDDHEMNGDDGHDMGEGDGHDRHFAHTSLILLVNRAGLVERAWTGGPPRPDRLLETVRTVIEEG